MSVNERFKILIDGLGYNPNSFADKLKVASPVIYNIVGGRKNRPSEELLEKLSIAFASVDLNWLIAGKGSMLLDDKVYPISLPNSLPNQYKIPEISTSIANEPQEKYVTKYKPRNKVFIVNQDVKAGLLVGFSQENIEPTEVVDIPWLEKGIFYLFNVRGDSMYPTLSSGDKVLARQLEGVQDIQNGQIHVLIHTKGMIVKRLNKSLLKEGFVEYRSDNEDEYQPDKIQVKNVMGLFEVVEAITCNLGNRNKDKELVKLYKQLLTNNGINF